MSLNMRAMMCLIITVFLITAFKGVQPQVTFAASGGDVKKPGDALQLSCKGSGFKRQSFGDYWMSWHRHTPSNGLEWVATISYWAGDTKHYAASVKERFTISRYNALNMLYLQMKNLQPGDSGSYYCFDAQHGKAMLSLCKNPSWWPLGVETHLVRRQLLAFGLRLSKLPNTEFTFKMKRVTSKRPLHFGNEFLSQAPLRLFKLGREERI